MKDLEFYSYDDEVWCRFSDGKTEMLDEHNTELIDFMYNTISEDYPETYSVLSQIYRKSERNLVYYKYVVVKRFIKCNFSKVDTTYIDMEDYGDNKRLNFEKVDCPLRGECPYEGIICQPRFSTNLTEREKTVAKYWYDGLSKNEIAELMFLSPETINNHIRRIYSKLNIHSMAEFVKYVDSKNMFKD